MMNAVGYTRYSTDRQSENSTQYQIAAIDEYARKNNIMIYCTKTMQLNSWQKAGPSSKGKSSMKSCMTFSNFI